MRRYLALVLALAATWPHAGFAKGKDKKDAAADSDDDDDDSDDTPKAKPKGKDKDTKDAKAKAKAKAKTSDDDDSDDDKPKAKDAKDKDAKAKAKAKPAKPADDDSDDDKDASKFGGKKVTGADAVGTGSDDDGGGGGDSSDSGSGGGSGEQTLQKQDLTGHDMGSTKKSNAFEQDRFFVDKRDDDKTKNGTLIQGSLTSTSLFYFENSGAYPTGMGAPPGTLGSPGSSFPEVWTDLRLQTDFRHIAGSAWDARVDGRIRLVDNPGDTENTDVPANASTVAVPNHVQSGLTGENEYELRELWLARNGDRTDVFFGRQFIADLAGVKIDGIRVDYASSQEFTLLGFAGLFPVRGSRSITTDYIDLRKDYNVTSQSLDPAGKLVTAGGFGAAYRTASAYGSFGGVAEIPIEGEGPRIFGTAQGYWRYGSTLDFYHFAVIDLIGSANLNVTNLSLGVNYKPNPQLRLTGSYNRYDTETLNVQANAFFNQPSTNTTLVQNQLFVSRLASNEARGSISAGLGNLQRFEITVAATYRERQPFTLYSPDGTTSTAKIPPGSSIELYAAITDRRSVADLRLGADVLDSFAFGGGDDTAYQRADIFAARLYAGRELANGKGEWEADAEYSTSKDTNNTTAAIDPVSTTASTGCLAIVDCYGVSNASVITIGGTLYYRFNRDWLGVATLYLSHTTLDSLAATATGATAQASDPPITGLNGFLRIAYRF